MAFVIPKWESHKVNNWHELIIYTEEGASDINPATAALLNYMPVIGITELKQENVEDVWRRIAIHQALFGSFLYEDCTYKKSIFFTRSDIERHVGLETEGKQFSFEEYCRDMQTKRIEKDESRLPSFIANGNSSLLSIVLESNSENDKE